MGEKKNNNLSKFLNKKSTLSAGQTTPTSFLNRHKANASDTAAAPETQSSAGSIDFKGQTILSVNSIYTSGYYDIDLEEPHNQINVTVRTKEGLVKNSIIDVEHLSTSQKDSLSSAIGLDVETSFLSNKRNINLSLEPNSSKPLSNKVEQVVDSDGNTILSIHSIRTTGYGEIDLTDPQNQIKATVKTPKGEITTIEIDLSDADKTKTHLTKKEIDKISEAFNVNLDRDFSPKPGSTKEVPMSLNLDSKTLTPETTKALSQDFPKAAAPGLAR